MPTPKKRHQGKRQRLRSALLNLFRFRALTQSHLERGLRNLDLLERLLPRDFQVGRAILLQFRHQFHSGSEIRKTLEFRQPTSPINAMITLYLMGDRSKPETIEHGVVIGHNWTIRDGEGSVYTSTPDETKARATLTRLQARYPMISWSLAFSAQ